MTFAAEATLAAGATRGSAIKLTAELAGRGMSLLTFLLLAPGLGVSAYGAFTALSVIAVVLAESGELGLQGLASQALVTGELRLRTVLRAKAVATSIGLGVGLGAASLAPVVGVSRSLGVLVVFFIVAGWSELLGVALRARGRATAEALVILCLRASGLVCVYFVLQAGRPSVEAVAWAHAASAVPPLALGAWLLRREVERQACAVSVGAVLRRSAPLAVNGGLALVSLRVELLVLKALRGAYETGVFALALRVVEFLSMVPAAVSAGAMPALAREARGQGRAARERTAWTVALLAGAACLGLVVVAPQVVAVVGKGEFAGAETPMRILALAVPALFANVLMSHALMAAGRPERLPRLTALRVVLAVGLAVVLAPSFGAVGAAFGFLASEFVLLGLCVMACRSVGFAVPVAIPFGAGLGFALPMAALVALAPGGLVIRVGVGVGVFVMTVGLVHLLAARRTARAPSAEDAGHGPE